MERRAPAEGNCAPLVRAHNIKPRGRWSRGAITPVEEDDTERCRHLLLLSHNPKHGVQVFACFVSLSITFRGLCFLLPIQVVLKRASVPSPSLPQPLGTDFCSLLSSQVQKPVSISGSSERNSKAGWFVGSIFFLPGTRPCQSETRERGIPAKFSICCQRSILKCNREFKLDTEQQLPSLLTHSN